MEDVKGDLDAPPPPPRRPRGFAATAVAAASVLTSGGGGGGGGGVEVAKGRKEREKEKERTKLRERHRRAITSRMLAGLRQYGNFPLPARADMNDVLAALAREAGWTVEADGTTYRSSPGFSTAQLASFPVRIDENSSPASLDSVVVMDRDMKDDSYVNTNHIDSTDCLEADELLQEMHSGHGTDFSGTPYVPVYVMLPNGVVNGFCQLVDPESVRKELRHLKLLHVDGVVVNCWWGIVEGWSPQKYLWHGYRDLFNIIREFKMKLQVVMAFSECVAIGSGDFSITLPKWVLEIGKDNQDIFFTDREGRRSTECLSWGVDKERVLKGRTAVEAYFDFMRSFRLEFNDLFAEGLISAVEIGLGASGELKYPSFSERMGWRYPGIGEFQCYDKYMQQSLRRAAKSRGHSFWARGPDNAGHYNAQPHETGFFSDRGDYDGYYGRFFLRWYSQTLISHADNVLTLARLAFEETEISVKIPAVYWWYRTTSHAAELTAGFYNPANRDGYCAIFEILKKHSATVKFVLSGPQVTHDDDGAFADSEGLNWQLLNSAWERGLSLAAQNALPCNDRDGYLRILDITKPRNDPDCRHLSFFSYQRPLIAFTQGEMWFLGLDYLVKCMHGEAISEHRP